MIKKRINNWFIHFQKYFFKYKQGFFELSYIANSPESTIESFKKTPFIKHNKKHQSFIMNNMFTNGVFKYYKLNDDLWLSVSDISYHKNVRFNLIYDDFIEEQFYTLSLNFTNNNDAKLSNLVNNTFPLANMSWILLKPKGNRVHTNIKGANGKYAIIYFTEKWLETQMQKKGVFHNTSIEKFIESDNSYCTILDNNKQLFELYNGLNALFKEEIRTTNTMQFKQFNNQSMALATYFANLYKQNNDFTALNSFTQAEEKRLLEIENYLMKNLTNHFIGIEELAKMFFISPTKLKSDFKSIYGVSIYQYYLSKQMILAHQLISEKNTLIKDVAAFLGYDNSSKFTIAYKKHFGFLPSENY